jgi:hypothetical protein
MNNPTLKLAAVLLFAISVLLFAFKPNQKKLNDLMVNEISFVEIVKLNSKKGLIPNAVQHFKCKPIMISFDESANILYYQELGKSDFLYAKNLTDKYGLALGKTDSVYAFAVINADTVLILTYTGASLVTSQKLLWSKSNSEIFGGDYFFIHNEHSKQHFEKLNNGKIIMSVGGDFNRKGKRNYFDFRTLGEFDYLNGSFEFFPLYHHDIGDSANAYKLQYLKYFTNKKDVYLIYGYDNLIYKVDNETLLPIASLSDKYKDELTPTFRRESEIFYLENTNQWVRFLFISDKKSRWSFQMSVRMEVYDFDFNLLHSNLVSEGKFFPAVYFSNNTFYLPFYKAIDDVDYKYLEIAM